MDILLTHGYYLYADAHEKEVMRPYPPLGILYIAGHLREQGFAVDLFDTTFSSMDDFAAAIAREKPPIVGIYCNMMTRRNVVKMIPICKQHGATVILGGPDPANYPENYLAHGADIVVIGEGEMTLSELIPHITKHGLNQLEAVHGIVFRQDEAAFHRTPARAYIDDLDAQPNPARDLIDIPQYMHIWKTNHGQSSVSLITARGCPYKCKWCSHAVFGYTHRRRSPQHVVDEVAQIKATYNPDLLWYADDVFTINHRWLYAYAEELTRRGLHTPFETISREDRLNEDVIKTLADMGCYRIWIGAESGSQRILDAMARRTNVERVIDMVHMLQKYGIQAGMFIMLGYKDEEEQDLIATVDTLKRANPDIFLTTVAYPIAGTKYFEEVADNVIPLKAWAQGSDADYTVAGRRSRQYYRHATRWMVGEVALNRQRQSTNPSYKQMAKAYLNMQWGRVGMRLTQHQVEHGL
jgi:anaerobic magnesium-protoporphyrin IX monomethyl ester cyclase